MPDRDAVNEALCFTLGLILQLISKFWVRCQSNALMMPMSSNRQKSLSIFSVTPFLRRTR